MKIFAAIGMLILSFTVCAAPASMVGAVLSYECKHIDSSDTGFSCAAIGPNTIQITFLKDPSTVAPDVKEYRHYKYAAFLTRYFELGGRYFVLLWAYKDAKKSSCSRFKNELFSFSCEPIS